MVKKAQDLTSKVNVSLEIIDSLREPLQTQPATTTLKAIQKESSGWNS